MRLQQAATSLLLSTLTTLVVANPYPRDNIRDFGFGYLMNRDCESYCGLDNQYCCSAGEQCITTTGRATCTAGDGGYAYSTTTWTETRTYTSTYSTYYPAATSAASGGTGGADCVPPEGTGQIACGPICCANWQYCAKEGQCLPNAGASTWWSTGTTVGVVTTAFSAPYRVTSGTTVFSTATGTAESATATATGTETAVPVTTTTSNQLSGGAIAGIVVGTILGVALLLALCACCIIRGLWNTFLAIFGFGKKRDKTERIEVIEEERRYSRHGSASGRAAHRTWFGGSGRPATVASRKEKKSSSGAGWLAGAGAATMLLLGLRRGDKKKESGSHKPARSDWSSSYYTESYTGTSPSSPGQQGNRLRGYRGTPDDPNASWPGSIISFPNTYFYSRGCIHTTLF
ncbi:uncharacterized protein BCR38DRAFT_414459 [Pseudomassariella vexata]|uniref:Uncharacterized protein n=1 Tax=Pseudomassariella vexata TaxID=1141098 RepID=A0A1Y2DBR1_9PEZI|nr:uncharacterized protein BCR38DRAFT_414459 [Pseudomassariella vexata]ORY56713.1 hypothetical protein BCR38DRAFT_414459 [Pseudomassariella vexata]